MDLQEVIRRVLFGHWVVILAAVIASSAGVAAWNIVQGPTYTASTRVVLDAPAPTSGTEATAVADAAKAIVTSPTHIQAALNSSGVVRDPLKLVPNITVVPVGTSGVLQLSVQDSDPVVAANIANALADNLIQTRLAISPAGQKAALDAQISSLNDELQALQVNSTNTQAAGVEAQILADRISVLESERASLGSVSNTTPSVIDPASVPTKPDQSKLPILLALALVIGAVIGVVVSAALETFRPTLTSDDAVAKALGVPVLGWLPDSRGTLPRRLKLAASANGIRAVELIAAGNVPDLPSLAKALRRALGDARGSAKPPYVYCLDDAPARYRKAQVPNSGYVVVAPQRIRKSELEPVQDLIVIGDRPLLGVIATGAGRSKRAALATVKPLPRLAVLSDTEKEGTGEMSEEMRSDLWGAQ
ncbi:MAG: hypothetical protein ACHQ0J_04070 [Candidatus Dormibacterales bacterium]